MVHDFFFNMTPCTYYLHCVAVRYRYGFTLAIALLAFLIWFFALHQPMIATLEITQKMLHQAQHQQVEEDNLKLEIGTLEQTIASLDKEYANKYARYAHNKKSPINNLIDAVHTHRLSLINHKLITKHHHSWYADKEYITEFSGSYTTLIDFFTAVAQSNFLINPHVITISKSDTHALTCHCNYKIIALKDRS